MLPQARSVQAHVTGYLADGYLAPSHSIDGQQVTWSGMDSDGDYEIFLYNGTRILQLTDNGFHDIKPTIDDGQVTWMGWDGNDYEIFFYDSDTTVQLTNNDYNDYDPQNSNGQVTWFGDASQGCVIDTRVYLYDGSGTIELAAPFWYCDSYGSCCPYNYNVSPQIDSGKVVWVASYASCAADGMHSTPYQVLLYDGSQIIQLSDSDGFHHSCDIDAGQVMWWGDEGIFVYPGNNGLPIPGTEADYQKNNPQLGSGQVAWERWDGTDTEIMVWDGASVTQLTDNSYNEILGGIDAGQVTWSSNSSGAQYGGEILLWNGVEVIQLTNAGPPGSLQIESGRVIWESLGGGQVFMYADNGDFPTYSAPAQPSNAFPSNGASSISLTPTLQSSAFSDPDAGDTHAASQWQITTVAGDYSSPVSDSGTDFSNLTSLTVPSGILTYSTSYYWHVRYKDNRSDWSDYSIETFFTTLDTVPPPIPNTVSPASWKKINSNATLDWSDVSDPSGVTYQIRLYNNSWSLLQEKRGLISSAYGVSSLGSLAEGTYYWRVRAVDGAGNASAWTTSWAFKLDNTLPSVPVHLSPTSWKQVNNSATLDWSDVSDPSGVTYQVRLYNSSWSLVKEKAGLTSSAYAVSSFGSLADGTYYWRVRAVDGAGNVSAWTTSWAFKLDNTLPSMPVHLSPTSWKKINSSATLDWSDISDPSGVTYQIRLYNSSWSLVKEKTGLTSSAYAVSSFGSLADGTYYWKVRAEDGAGNVSAWTTSWAFKLDNTLP
jgi:hypothetical protein